jgi:hypothetical protein
VQAGDPPRQVVTGSGATACAKRSVEAKIQVAYSAAGRMPPGKVAALMPAGDLRPTANNGKLLIALTPMMILNALRERSKESSEGQKSASRKEALVQWQNTPGMAAHSGRRTVRKSKCES